MRLHRIALLFALTLIPAGVSTHAAEPAASSPADTDHGLLWRIEKTGVAPSYLFGTMHSGDPRVLALPKAVAKAFHNADRLTLEIPLDGENLSAAASAMINQGGPDLATVLGPDLYRKAVRAMAQAGVPEEAVTILKPWALAVALMEPDTNDSDFLDLVLYRDALARGKPVNGLETVAEQIAIFDDLSQADQITLVTEALQELPNKKAMYEDLHTAYLKNDLRAIAAINDAATRKGNPELAQRLTQRAITDRNLRMAKRMQTGLQQGNTFFAVGALHLPGESGLLALLRQQGYTVTPVR